MRLLRDPKRLLSILIGSGAGALVLLGYLQPNALADGVLTVAQFVTALAILIGLGSMVAVQLRSVRLRTRGWPYSLLVVITAVTVFGLELLPAITGSPTQAEMSELSGEVVRYIYQPLATSVLGLLTFFALRAAWRAMYTRPKEAGIILVVAVIFLVADGPLGTMVPGVQESLAWIRTYPIAGITRGLVLGISLGALVASVRLLLGFDVPYLDR